MTHTVVEYGITLIAVFPAQLGPEVNEVRMRPFDRWTWVTQFPSVFLHLFWIKLLGISGTDFLWSRYPPCHPICSVNELKVTESAGPDQWPSFIHHQSCKPLLCCMFTLRGSFKFAGIISHCTCRARRSWILLLMLYVLVRISVLISFFIVHWVVFFWLCVYCLVLAL